MEYIDWYDDPLSEEVRRAYIERSKKYYEEHPEELENMPKADNLFEVKEEEEPSTDEVELMKNILLNIRNAIDNELKRIK